MGYTEGRIELPNRLTVGGSVAEMNLSLGVRVGDRAGGLDEEIGLAGNRIVVSDKRFQAGKADVVEVGAEIIRGISREMTVLEDGGGIEFSGSVGAAQSGVVKNDGMEGNLDGAGKRVPVRFEWTSIGCGGGGGG